MRKALQLDLADAAEVRRAHETEILKVRNRLNKKKLVIVDLFAGAGGTSTGAVQAAESSGLNLDLTAINHWDVAVDTHSRNHPWANHVCTDISALNPKTATGKGSIDVLLASPDCTHHSRARGGKPINDQRRTPAWCVVTWAAELQPRVILIENVQEFQEWGPVGVEGQPLKSRKGEVFRAFIGALQALGYRVEWRVLCAANYGGATTRERLFIIAKRGRSPIRWPDQSHMQDRQENLFGLRPWRTAREIIDWNIPGKSIFTRKKPLAPATLERIAAGLRKFGGASAEPFLVILRNHMAGRSIDEPVPTVAAGGQHVGLCQPFMLGQQSCSAPRGVSDPVPTISTAGAVSLIQPFIISAGGPEGQGRNATGAMDPLATILTHDHKALVQPFVFSMEHGGKRPAGFVLPVNHGKDSRTYSLDGPMPTITTVDAWGCVEPLLVEYNGTGDAHPLSQPCPTVTTRDRFGLAEFAGIDILFRMLQPHELAAAMGFPANYQFAGNREEKVKQIGNAVQVDQARALCSEVFRMAAA